MIRLRGGGEEGLGEDVTYDAVDHEILQAAGPDARARRAASRSPPSASTLASSTLFPEPPQREVSQRYRTWAYESAALDLALRQAGTHAARGARPRAPAGALRRLAAPRRAADDRAAAPAARALPGLRFKLDPTSSWNEQLIAELVDDGRRRLGRLQGLLHGLDRRPARRPGPLPARRRGLPRGVDRGPGADARDRRRARGPPRALLLGRADPLDRGHRGAALSAADGQHQALAARRPAQPARRLRLLRRARASATTAAASSSSASAAARTSTWPRCSTPTRPTTSRPTGFNLPLTRRGPAVEPAPAGAVARRASAGAESRRTAGATSMPQLGLPPLDG